MKKLLLLLFTVTLFISGYSQLKNAGDVKVFPASCGKKCIRVEKTSSMRDEFPPRIPKAPPFATRSQSSVIHTSTVLTEEVIGNTWYDNQSNRSVPRRISNNGDGTLSAVWNFSPAGPIGSWPDRGTGYNYFDGTNWAFPPMVRIEPLRTGFTNIDFTPQMGECVVAHTGATGLIQSNRATKGTGTWDTTTVGTYNLFPSQADVWARNCVGGANGSTVHVIVNSQGTGTTPVLNQFGPLTYSRSLDGGVTWVDDHIQIPGTDASFIFGVGADEYNIDSRGDVVAIVIGGFTNDVMLLKSLDNGVTWTKTIIQQFPIPLYDETTMISDVNGDGVPDTIHTNAGDVTVTIDNNNICHVAYGDMYVIDDSIAGNISYLPTTDGLMYWHEGLSAPVKIAACEDFNGNGIIDLPQSTGVGVPAQPFGNYNIGLTGQPSIGVDSSNNIFIAYSAIDERADTSAFFQALRHIFLIATNDMGVSWSNPFCADPDPLGNGAFEEESWPSVATLVDDNVHIVYQRDPAPGTSMSTDAVVAANNSFIPSDIIYVKVFAPALINYNTITGNCFVDINQNGVRDAGENGFSNLTVSSNGNYQYATTPDVDGYFTTYADTGTTITTVQNLHYYTVTPSQHISNFSSYLNTDSVNFAVVPIPGIQDLRITLIPFSFARPGFSTNYRLIYENVGTATMNGSVYFLFDSDETYLSSVPASSNLSGDTLEFNYSNLLPNETRYIDVTLLIAPPPAVNFGDVLHLFAYIDPIATDTVNEDNSMNLNQTVQGSYDPNDKTMLGGSFVTPTQIASGDYLHYLIRFQNTGSDTAFTIVVRDTLSANLDWNSFEMESASHPYQLTIKDGNILKWQFNHILLADSSTNEPESHGYIAYKIKPLSSLGMGVSINNTAHIYFDFNTPVSTNTSQTVVGVSSIKENSADKLSADIYPNPTTGRFTIRLGNVCNNAEVKICNAYGQQVYSKNFNNIQRISDKLNVERGVYFIHIESEKGNTVLRMIKQ